MVGRQTRVRGQWCPRLCHLHPSTRGGVVGVHLEHEWVNRLTSVFAFLLHRLLEAVDVVCSRSDHEDRSVGVVAVFYESHPDE